jgi:hypothetical protein
MSPIKTRFWGDGLKGVKWVKVVTSLNDPLCYQTMKDSSE